MCTRSIKMSRPLGSMPSVLRGNVGQGSVASRPRRRACSAIICFCLNTSVCVCQPMNDNAKHTDENVDIVHVETQRVVQTQMKHWRIAQMQRINFYVAARLQIEQMWPIFGFESEKKHTQQNDILTIFSCCDDFNPPRISLSVNSAFASDSQSTRKFKLKHAKCEISARKFMTFDFDWLQI